MTDVIASSHSTLEELIQNLSPSAKRVFEESAADTDVKKAREAVAFANIEKKTGAKIVKTESALISEGVSGVDNIFEAVGENYSVSIKTFTSESERTIVDEILDKADKLSRSSAKSKKNIVYIQTFENNSDLINSVIEDILNGSYSDNALTNSNDISIVVSKIPEYLR